ncbi:MAG: GlxA family transcriptional regulator, partial [Kofleriaceae bacterium]
MPEARRIAVYAVFPPRALLLDLTGPLEVLRRANLEQPHVQFDVHPVSPRRDVMTSIGVVAAGLAPLPAELPAGAMVVIGGSVSALTLAEDRDAAHDRRDAAAIVAWLRGAVRDDHTVISICSGALLAARAGLLDGK